ncbi:unnamed protein product [Ceutorhynchus assimilis]|uniref:Uncharacterized protein n=1 Tax=Ceutorhynchus assimilis TaxID=467358 RepID=A0A9N9QH69_9CUCU|nr:unnamed protein product [Ceutorhynchus assimilis]
MEIEFGKHFRDATNLLLSMDYDSGYVEAGESSSCTSSNPESVSSAKMSVPKVSQNFLFNEDALLEKPEIALNWSTNLPYEIDLEEYEESRQLFFSFSPGFINASVKSDDSSLPYSGLESETSSNVSTDLPIQKPIKVLNKADIQENEIMADDVLIISASENDMSLEVSELVSEEELGQNHQGCNNLITGNTGESAIETKSSNNSYTNEDSSPQNTEDEVSPIGTDSVSDVSFVETEKDITCNSSKQATPDLDGSFSVKSTGIWSVQKTPKKLSPSKSNPIDSATNILEKPKEKRRLTLVFCKSEKENVYSVKRKYPSLTPTKRTPEKTYSSEQAYSYITPEKNSTALTDSCSRPKKSSKKNVNSCKHNLSSTTPEKTCSLDEKTEHMYPNITPKKNKLELADNVYSTEKNLHNMTSEKACSSAIFNKKTSASELVNPCMTPEKKTPELADPRENVKENVYSFDNKVSSITPQKKTPKLADHYVSPMKDVNKNIDFKQKLPTITPEKKIQKVAGPTNSPKGYNAYVIEAIKTPAKSPLELADPRENVKKNVFKEKLFNLTPEKKTPQQEEDAISNIADPYVRTKQNFKSKFLSMTPEKTLQKLAVNNTRKKINGNFVEENNTPEKQPCKPVDQYFSPDLFDDDDIVDESMSSYSKLPTQKNILLLPKKPQNTEEKYTTKLDQKLLKRTQKGMSGVLPPPSITIMHLSVGDILSKWEENKSYCFWAKSEKSDLEEQDKSLNSSTSTNSYSKSLLLSVDVEEAKQAEWPNIYDMRCHGLSYNCGKVSEEIVDLCDKYQKRFVGAETQSTCTIFEKQNISSPSNRKTTKPRFGAKSPGRRLSHLALRRKITFSHANSQANSSSLVGSRARQILVDVKKLDLLSRRRSPRKTPKKTPSKSPRVKTKTPSSSAKKKLAMRFRKLTGEFQKAVPDSSEMSSSQRALFNSPVRGASQSVNRSTKRALFQSPGSNSNSSSIFSNKSLDLCGSQEKRQFRRNLFASPKKNSPIKVKKSPFKQFGMERKRKRSESDDLPGAKVNRSMSMDRRPSTSTSDLNESLSRTQSDWNVSLNRSQSHLELTEIHKRKLIWAVSGALKSQNVTSTHPQYKLFASVLARVTRRFYVDQIQTKTGKLECSTSDRMHRIARHHVISVIKGKTADEIFNDYVTKNRASRVQRPQGYIAPEEFNQSKTAPSSGKETALQDRSNTMESWEKRKTAQMSKPSENRIDRIRKVINFGEDR